MNFESELMSNLAASTHPDAKAMKRWFDKHPKGPLRKRALKRLEDATNGDAKSIDWSSSILVAFTTPAGGEISHWFPRGFFQQ